VNKDFQYHAKNCKPCKLPCSVGFCEKQTVFIYKFVGLLGIVLNSKPVDNTDVFVGLPLVTQPRCVSVLMSLFQV